MALKHQAIWIGYESDVENCTLAKGAAGVPCYPRVWHMSEAT